jgi:hypothetical protein
MCIGGFGDMLEDELEKSLALSLASFKTLLNLL